MNFLTFEKITKTVQNRQNWQIESFENASHFYLFDEEIYHQRPHQNTWEAIYLVIYVTIMSIQCQCSLAIKPFITTLSDHQNQKLSPFSRIKAYSESPQTRFGTVISIFKFFHFYTNFQDKFKEKIKSAIISYYYYYSIT